MRSGDGFRRAAAEGLFHHYAADDHPAVISGWLLAFTLSLDDLVIASFVSGPGATTLPMLVFSSVRMGVNPEINALATLILGVVGIVGFIAWYLMARAEKQRVRDIQRARRS